MAELALLRSFGVPRVQGFLLARPVASADLQEAISAGLAALRRPRGLCELGDAPANGAGHGFATATRVFSC